jgi:hypothetical protein
VSSLLRERSAVLKDFSGGLNNYWDPSAIAENEVPYLINMEFTPTGALTSRPAITQAKSFSGTTNFEILGYFINEVQWRVLIYTVNGKTYADYLEGGLSGTTYVIWNEKATGFVQYANEVVLCKATTGGRRWNPGTSTFTAIPTMPALDGLIVFKERFFGWGVTGSANSTKMYWSDLTAIGTGSSVWDWNVDSVANVGFGDGYGISKIIPDYTQLYIFKTESTYGYTYSELPEDGTLSLIQHGIGAENKYCVAPYQNGYVVFNKQTVYKFMNNAGFAPLNAQKIRFEKDPNVSENLLFKHAVSILGDRAIIYYLGNLYVLNLQLGTWSQWKTDTKAARFLQAPVGIGYTQYNWAIAATAETTVTTAKMYRIEDQPVASAGSEQFVCHIKTRTYDFNTPSEWKRLYWWAADISADGAITATVTVIAASSTVRSWDQLETVTWDALDLRTWDRILSENAYVTTVRNINEGVPQRSLLKLDHSIRFRRAYFEVYFSCDGTAETSPAQIFSITPMIGVKAKMTKGVA